jgi:hypothetical protein
MCVCVYINHISMNPYFYLTIFYGISPFCIPHSHPLTIKTVANNCLGLTTLALSCGVSVWLDSHLLRQLRLFENEKGCLAHFLCTTPFLLCVQLHFSASKVVCMHASIHCYNPHMRHTSAASHSQQDIMTLHWMLVAFRHALQPSLANSSCKQRSDNKKVLRKLAKIVE